MTDTTYTCSLCDHVPFQNAQGLGRHKQAAHGISGASKSTKKEKENHESNSNGNTGMEPVDSVQEIQQIDATKSNSKRIKAKRSAQKEKALARSQKAENNIPNGYQIPEGALAVAFGRFQELCRSFAWEYNLPPKLLTSRLSELISASAIR